MKNNGTPRRDLYFGGGNNNSLSYSIELPDWNPKLNKCSDSWNPFMKIGLRGAKPPPVEDDKRRCRRRAIGRSIPFLYGRRDKCVFQPCADVAVKAAAAPRHSPTIHNSDPQQHCSAYEYFVARSYGTTTCTGVEYVLSCPLESTAVAT
jgi:hypothetical protein